MTLQAKFFAFVAPVLLVTAAVPPLLWYFARSGPVSPQVVCGAVLLCGGLVFTALITVYFAAARLVCRPMRQMAAEMNRLSAGGALVKPLTEAHRSDELGLAARSFNQVLETLQWTTTVLREMNASLELRVTERTDELAAGNAELLTAEQKYRSIFENATEGIFQTSPDGRPLTANPAMVKLLGYDSEEQLISMVVNVATHVYADAGTRAQLLEQLEAIDRVDQFPAEMLRRDGTKLWTSMSAQVIRGTDGKCHHLQGFVRDITDARRQQLLQKQSEAEARKLALIASKTHNPILITDPQGHLEWANNAFTSLTGYTLAELIGKKPGAVLQGAETDPAAVQQMRDCIAGGKPFQVEVVNYSRDGRKYWLCIDAEPVLGESGQVEHFIAFEEDITERKRADWMEQDRRDLLEMIARDEPLAQTLHAICRVAERQWEQVRGMVLLNDGDRREIAAAPQLSPGFVLGMDTLLSDDCANAVFTTTPEFVPDLSSDPRWISMHEAVRNEGLAACSQVPINSGSGKPLGTLTFFQAQCTEIDDHDLTAMQSLAGLAGLAIEHHQLIARLEYQAVHDPLTGLANRAQLESQLPKWIAAAARHDRSLAVLMIDLDGFKTVNDTLGHRAGDQLLRQVAARLSSTIRETDVLVRMGGDEFTLVATEIESAASLKIIADRLIEALSAAFTVENRELFVTASIGIAVYPTDGIDGAGLQRSADSAMYAAKAAGRNRALRFDPTMGESALDRLETEGQLRRAISQNEFLLEYQPQYNRRGEITGIEALVRWQHPMLGRIAPTKFIPLAEQCGLIVPIGMWVLRETCRQAKAWQDAGCPAVPVAVNVSALQFQQSDFLEILASALADTQLSPEYLELELTESLLMTDTAEAIRKVVAARAMGVGVSIDDFGTGYSSLAYLQKLPIDQLKIDQSFVKDLGSGITINTEGTRTAVITAITALAASLGMRVVAEGVETIAQRDYLIDIGCDALQGFLFSRPVHADRMEAMLRAALRQSPALAGAA